MRNKARFRLFQILDMHVSSERFRAMARVQIRNKAMTVKKNLFSAAFVACLLATSVATAQPVANPAMDPTGEWIVAKRVARIRIVDCDGRLWGVVSWEAQPGTDSNNPDPNLRSRPTLGMPILLGMAQSKENKWEGEIYNSEDGHTYSANITLSDPNTLRVQGCFLGFLCGGENWTRADATDISGSMPPQSPPQKPPANPGRKTTGTRPGSTDKTTSNQPETSQDICLRIVGAPGLSHERGLK